MTLEGRDEQSGSPVDADQVHDRRRRCLLLDSRVKAGLRAGRAAMWATAEALFHFNEESAWRELGYATRAEWLGDPEVGLTERSYQRFVRVWREAVVLRRIDPPALARLDLSKVEIVLPAVEEGSSSFSAALTDVEAMNWRELRRKYGPGGRATPGPTDSGSRDLTPNAAEHAAPGAHGEGGATCVAEPRRAAGDTTRKAGGGGEVDEALVRWLALYREVRRAAAAGEAHAGVDAGVIVPGLDALAHLLRAAGVRDIDRLMP